MADMPLPFTEVLAARRMVRAFSDRPIDAEKLDVVIAALLRGPSAGNTQSTHALVLTGEQVASYWKTTLPVDRREEFPWPGLLIAPALVIPYVEPARYVERYGEPDKVRTGLGGSPEDWSVPYWWVDGGAAVQSALLAAVAEGLGACFFGQFDHEPAVRSTFGVPDGFRAVGTVAVGWEDIEAGRASRSAQRGRRPLGETVHRNGW